MPDAPLGRSPPLTMKQRACLEALVRYRVREGRSPALRELAGETGAALSTVHHLLGMLARKGYIRRAYATTRGIELLAPALPGGWPYLGESPT